LPDRGSVIANNLRGVADRGTPYWICRISDRTDNSCVWPAGEGICAESL
jgi:hypothetical protein